MANYWDDFKPSLLAGEDYWEDFTPEAPTETGVVGKVTGKRYQPWEKGYHKMAGLVDDSGQYDAWYDPDPPPETSRPAWGTPEGYENWKNRIALETGSGSDSGTGSSGAEGGPGHSGYNAAGQSVDYMDRVIDQGVPLSESIFAGVNMKDLDWSKALLGFGLGGLPGAAFGLFSGQINGFVSSLLDGSYFNQDTDPGIQSVPEANSRSMAESFSEGQALEE